MDVRDEIFYWKKQAAWWKESYEDLKKTLYNQWARNQRQHDQLMEKLATQQTNESDYIQKLERANERLEKSLEAHFIDKKLHDQNVDELIAHKDHQYDYIQKLEDENAQLRAELKRETE